MFQSLSNLERDTGPAIIRYVHMSGSSSKNTLNRTLLNQSQHCQLSYLIIVLLFAYSFSFRLILTAAQFLFYSFNFYGCIKILIVSYLIAKKKSVISPKDILFQLYIIVPDPFLGTVTNGSGSSPVTLYTNNALLSSWATSMNKMGLLLGHTQKYWLEQLEAQGIFYCMSIETCSFVYTVMNLLLKLDIFGCMEGCGA